MPIFNVKPTFNPMAKNLLAGLLVLLIIPAQAQRTFELGVAGGVTNFFGDLGNEKVFQRNSTRPGTAVTVRNFIGNSSLTGNQYNPFSFEFRFSWHRIGYDESQPVGRQSGFELRNYGRGIAFRNDLYGVATHMTYTFYRNKRLPLHKQGAAVFFFAGVGYYYGVPKADLFRGTPGLANRYFYWADGTTRDQPAASGYGNIVEKDGEYETTLADWVTEAGQADGEVKGRKKYSRSHAAFPFGFGFRFGLSKMLTLSAEFGYYQFLTDYLDDVSDQYVTYYDLEQLYPNDPGMQELALYVSDPTGFGTTGYPGPATSRRGNPDKKDAYSFVNLELAYKINFRSQKIRFFGRR
jgi:hypothetical protein